MAYQPGRSCPFSGEERLGNTRGHVVSINSRNTYVSDAAGNYIREGHAIIFVPDANGLNYASAILADQFAAAGYLTVVAEWANKFAPMDEQEPPQFVMKYTPAAVPVLNPDQRDTLLRDTVDYLQNTCKITGDLGIVAYGEGLHLAMRLLTRNDMKTASSQLCNVTYAGFIADPGAMTLPEIDARSAPLSIAIGDEATQPSFPLQARLRAGPSPHQLTTYSYVQDGFAVRRAVTSRAELFFKKQAFVQAITWMNEFLLDGAPLISTENPIPPKPPSPTTSQPGSTSTNHSTANGTNNPQNGHSAKTESSQSSTSLADSLTPGEIEAIKKERLEEDGVTFLKNDSKGFMIFTDKDGNLFDAEGEAITTPATGSAPTTPDPTSVAAEYVLKNVEVRAYDDKAYTDAHGNEVFHDEKGYRNENLWRFIPRSVLRVKGPSPNEEVEEEDEDDLVPTTTHEIVEIDDEYDGI